MFDMFLWYVRHVPLVCSTCSFDMFSMFLQYVQHAHNTCSSCKNYMYLHVLPHVPCSMCMFFSGGPKTMGPIAATLGVKHNVYRVDRSYANETSAGGSTQVRGLRFHVLDQFLILSNHWSSTDSHLTSPRMLTSILQLAKRKDIRNFILEITISFLHYVYGHLIHQNPDQNVHEY